MEDFYIAERVSCERILCVSPLSRRSLKETGVRGLGGDEGYFIYETDYSRPKIGIEIFAKASSFESALRLFEVIRAVNKQSERDAVNEKRDEGLRTILKTPPKPRKGKPGKSIAKNAPAKKAVAH